MSRHALLAGSTGLIGSLLLRQLLDDPRYDRVTALSRRELPLQHERLQVLLTDFDDLDRRRDMLGADDVFCALGTTMSRAGSRSAFEQVDHGMVLALAQAARRAGARQFVLVSAAGSSATSPSFYSRTKARVESDLRALGYPGLHILRPSLLLGDRRESRPMEQLAQRLSPALGWLARGPMARYAPVQAATVATAMRVIALRDQAGTHVYEAPFPA